jgi:tetratricopeptide (TPR) repeat protein
MRKITFIALLFLIGTVLTGCTAKKLIKRGDASMLANRPAEAARYYREALEHDSDLVEKADFVAKFKRARSQAAYKEGKSLANQGLWEQAAVKFSESLEIDPEFAQAERSLAKAKKEASKQCHKRALEYADQGKLNQAIIELKRALEFDPDNLDAKNAIDSVSSARKDRQNKTQILYDSALALQGQKKWMRSSEALRAVVRLNPNHLPSRTNLHRSDEVLRQARAKYHAGSRLANEGRLDEAIAALKESLDIWPYFDEASGALARTQARRDESERLYTDAARLAKQRRWDDAIRQADAALKIYPFHRPAGDVRVESKRSAAAEHCEAGNRLLTGNNLAEAEKEFQRSLGYVPFMVPAREGLARADCIRGVADQEKGQWGSALLWYTEANNHISKPEYLSKITVARSRVLSRISFGIGVNAANAGVWQDAESSALRSRVFAGVSARKPQFLRLESAKNIAKPPSYTVTVNLEDLSVRGGLVRSENRTHHYTTYREIPNPEIPRLSLLLQIARRDLARLMRDFNRQRRTSGRFVCQTCRGTGKERCTKCRGTGKVKCTKCRGKGKIKGRTCSRCKGTGKRKCPTCRGSKKILCSVCSGRGKKRRPVQHPRHHGHVRVSRVTRRQIERKRAQVRRLQHQLAMAPVTVTESFSAEWPYVINHYEKSGAIRTRIQITSNVPGATPEVITVRKTFRQKDATVNNPNPRIGLRADPLILSSNDEVRTSLIRTAGSEVAAKIVAAVLKAKASEVRVKAENASRRGNSIDATEAYVDLVHIMRPYDSTAAARLLERLRRQRR